MMTAKPREPITHWAPAQVPTFGQLLDEDFDRQERRISGENLPHVVSIREGGSHLGLKVFSD